jgi:hypothetical protein
MGLRALVTQLLTNFRLAGHLIFLSFASALHATVASFRATVSALDIFAASAGVGTNAVPLISPVAIITQFKDHEELVALWLAHGDETIAEWDMQESTSPRPVPE